MTEKPLFNDALLKALSPVQKRMRAPHAPEQETEEEPRLIGRRYQGPPTIQPQGGTNA